jgi:hypothetical protein
MHPPKNPSSYPAPDESRIEELLSNIQPTPGKAFYTRMQHAPWKAVQIKRTNSMKTKFAFSALVIFLVMVATVAFVPPVRAQVAEWFNITFHDPSNPEIAASAGISGQSMKYQVMQPTYLPAVFSGGATFIAFGDISEILYQAGDQFLVITQQAAKNGEPLPQGDAATVNGQPAALNTGLTGRYEQLPLGELEASGVVSAGEEPQSGTLEGIDPNAAPMLAAFNYTDATRLTFMIGNTSVEILSNLAVEELIKIAESLTPAQ